MTRIHPLLAASLGLVVTMGCAGGGSGPSVTGEAAASLFASYSGRWELDVSSSTAQIPNPLEGVKDEVPIADISRNETRYMRRIRRMYESRRMSNSHMRTTIEVLRRRPETLIMTADDTELVYTPIPGNTMTIPMDGTEIELREGEHRVRTNVDWDGSLLSLEHQVVAGGRVKETLEVIGDRLVMTRSVTTGGGASEPLVLAYDRN